MAASVSGNAVGGGIVWHSRNVSPSTSDVSGTPALNITFDPSPPDTIKPLVNISLNNTALQQGFIINVTGNSSDDIGLNFCQIITNQTGERVFYNSSLSGTSGFCAQNITIATGINSVINFTVLVNDTSNNKQQAELTIAVADTDIPLYRSGNFSAQSITDGSTITLTINTSDATSNLNTIRFNFSNPVKQN